MENEIKCGFIKNYIEKNGKHFGFISEKGTKTDFYFMDSDLAHNYTPKKGDFVKFTVIQEARGKSNARAGVINLFSTTNTLTKNKAPVAKSKPIHSSAPLPPPCPHCGAQKGVRYGWSECGIKHNICLVCGKEHTFGDLEKRNNEIIEREKAEREKIYKFFLLSVLGVVFIFTCFKMFSFFVLFLKYCRAYL